MAPTRKKYPPAAWSSPSWAITRSSSVVFDEIGPRFATRNGGYTRVVKLGPASRGFGRDGDIGTNRGIESRCERRDRAMIALRVICPPVPWHVTNSSLRTMALPLQAASARRRPHKAARASAGPCRANLSRLARPGLAGTIGHACRAHRCRCACLRSGGGRGPGMVTWRSSAARGAERPTAVRVGGQRRGSGRPEVSSPLRCNLQVLSVPSLLWSCARSIAGETCLASMAIPGPAAFEPRSPGFSSGGTILRHSAHRRARRAARCAQS